MNWGSPLMEKAVSETGPRQMDYAPYRSGWNDAIAAAVKVMDDYLQRYQANSETLGPVCKPIFKLRNEINKLSE